MAVRDAVYVETRWWNGSASIDVMVYVNGDGEVCLISEDGKERIYFDGEEWAAIERMVARSASTVASGKPVGVKSGPEREKGSSLAGKTVVMAGSNEIPGEVVAFLQEWAVDGFVLGMNEYNAQRPSDLLGTSALLEATGLGYKEIVEGIGLKVAMGPKVTQVRAAMAQRKEAKPVVSGNGFHPQFVAMVGRERSESAAIDAEGA